MEEIIPESSCELSTYNKAQTTPSHKASTITSIIILTCAIFSHVFNNSAYFHYNLLLIILYSIMFFSLNIYNYKKKHISSLTIMWHQLIHWAGIILLAYITSLFINTGIMSNQQGGHVLLILIATTLFTIGLYTDICFLVCGLGITTSLFVSAHSYSHQLLLNTGVCITFSFMLYFLNSLTSNQ